MFRGEKASKKFFGASRLENSSPLKNQKIIKFYFKRKGKKKRTFILPDLYSTILGTPILLFFFFFQFVRMGRNFAGSNDTIVIDHGYHGNTTALIGISPYKFQDQGKFIYSVRIAIHQLVIWNSYRPRTTRNTNNPIAFPLTRPLD